MVKVNEIRSLFLNFFKKNNHTEIESSSLVPQNDPTLMFTNSGMVQFKNVFTGLESRSYKRAVTSQKCVRAGGKHNDLENVGYTSRHHTFFEMLGNFSFGDYFKDFAIEQAWNLVTKEFGLNPEKLLVTVYHEDLEAANLWKKIANLPEKKIIKISTSDNFWSMGDLGPCGPCSEIFYDHGSKIDGGPPGSANEDGDRFIEIWNLVFMQYEQRKNERINLPKPSIDTGMGLERMAAILQGKHDNYDVDMMRNIIKASSEITKKSIEGDYKSSHKVIADHIRASSFLIADGVLPSNEGRGYVLRRIMRRAMRHFHQLECNEPEMYKLVPCLINEMGTHYDELIRAESLITETLKIEETRFKDALARGMKILNTEIEKYNSKKNLDGKTAFKLYDTYGFPIDLTEDYMRSLGWSVDLKGFKAEMENQKKTARNAWIGSGSKSEDKIFIDLYNDYGSTEFLGYQLLETVSLVKSIIINNEKVDKISKDNEAYLMVNQTPFYAESGGQLGDTGEIVWTEGKGEITDTQKSSGVYLHKVKITQGVLCVGDTISMRVNTIRRAGLSANHSATHLLHEALREVLGNHVVQKGSMVSSSRLRFDFSHNKSLTENEKEKIEDIVNFRIRECTDVNIQISTRDEAIKKGALALFGEKYGNEVRVVSMGANNKSNNKIAWSVELCGGTHVSNTSDIILFRLLSETAVSSGVRRIEAISHKLGFEYLVERDKKLSQISLFLNTTSDKIIDKIKQLDEEKRKTINELSIVKRKIINKDISSNENLEKIGQISFVSKILNNTSSKDLMSINDNILKNQSNMIVSLFSINEKKCSILISVSKDIQSNFNAIDIVKKVTEILGGKGGGGRPDLAQSGGTKSDKIDDAIKFLKDFILNKIENL